MNEFFDKLSSKLMPLMQKVTAQKHLCAVRDALVATIPLTIVGAIFLLIRTFPFPASYAQFIAQHPTLNTMLAVPYRMTLGMLSVYVAYGIGSFLSGSYGMDKTAGGIIGLLCFLTTMDFSSLEQGSFLSTAYLGGEGMFTAILGAFLGVEVMHFCHKMNLTIKMPDSVPPNIAHSFDSLIPIAIATTIIAILVHGLGFDINAIFKTVLTPLLSASSDSIIAPLVFVFLTAVLWFFGIHPAVLSAIMAPIWTVNATANMEAVAAGLAIPHLGVKPFIFTFLWIGGGGGTLALCLMMCFSKSEQLKQLGRLSIVPGIFNINEPILFGLPIVLNPIMIVPFFTGPIICTIVTYLAFSTGIVPGMAYPLAAAWNFPSFIAGPVCTTSLSSLLLVIVNFCIYFAVYYPFFKMYEKKILEDELASAAE